MKEMITKNLKNLGISYRTERHKPVFTVEESKQHLKDKIPVKSLLLKEKKGNKVVLAVLAGDKRLDINQLSDDMGLGKLEFGKPELLKKKLNVTPGSVSLFGLLHEGSASVRVAIDDELVRQDEVGFHPNDNTSTLFIKGKDILTFIKYTGHVYRILKL